MTRALLALCLSLPLAPGQQVALAQTSRPDASEAPLPGLGGDIRLTDATGKPFVLSQQPPQATLLFFGFTQCAQACPPSLALMKALAMRMQPRQPPRMVFVTLDPLSDSPAALHQYLAQFDPRIVGLTGSPTQVDALARRYGVSTSTRQGVLDHSARLYLLGPDQRLARVYTLHIPLAQLARDIQAVQSPLLSISTF
jgi:protein SCO1/2